MSRSPLTSSRQVLAGFRSPVRFALGRKRETGPIGASSSSQRRIGAELIVDRRFPYGLSLEPIQARTGHECSIVPPPPRRLARGGFSPFLRVRLQFLSSHGPNRAGQGALRADSSLGFGMRRSPKNSWIAGARTWARTPTTGSRASFAEKGCLSGTPGRCR